MNGAARQSLAGIVAKYELEPTLREVYVEGCCDRRVLRWVLNEVGLSRVRVYEVDQVEVPAGTVLALGLADNMRGRVIALAGELDRLSDVDLRGRVVCWADRDLDSILNVEHSCGLVLLTDYPAMESYCLTERTLGKVVAVTFAIAGLGGADVAEGIGDVMKEMFLIRAASASLSTAWRIVSCVGQCGLVGTRIAFRRGEYVRVLLDANQARQDEELLEDEVERLRDRLGEDRREWAHGHDLVRLLRWYLRHWNAELGRVSESVFGGALLGAVERADLLDEQAFRELVRRLTQ